MRFPKSGFVIAMLVSASMMSAVFSPRRALGEENLPRPKFELTPDSKAMSDLLATASSDLVSQRFEKLESDAAQFRESKATFVTGEWKLGMLYSGTAYSLNEKNNDANFLLGIFDSWIEKKPDSITARVAKANALVNYAWRLRGPLSHDASAAELKSFNEKLTAARLVLREAKKLPAKCPYWWVVALRIGMAEQWDRKTYDSVFQEAIAFEPDCDEFYFQKAQYLRANPGDIENEWQAYVKAAADARGGEAGDILYARILWSLDKVGLIDNSYSDDAVSFERYDKGFAALLKANPDNLLILNEWARMCAFTGSFEAVRKRKASARKSFEKIGEHADPWVWHDVQQFIALRAATFDLPDFYKRGIQKLQEGDNKGAIADFDQALQTPARNGEIYSARAVAKMNLKQFDSALDDIEHAYTREPKNAVYYAQLSSLRVQTKQWQFAISAANRAIELDDSLASPYDSRARAQRALGELQEAVSDFGKALERAPNAYSIYLARGHVFYDQRKWKEGLDDFQKFLSFSKSPDDKLYTHLYIWLIRARQGETAAASKELKSFLNAKKTPNEWAGKIAAFLLGEVPEAQLLTAAEDKDENRALEKKTEAYFYAGMKHLIDGDKNGARERLQKVADFKHPDFVEARSAVAELQALPAHP
jgi:lipoprotein NlpI